MTRYAVGDVQGCLQPLQRLLQRVSFNPKNDQLWLVGDLINRGPESKATLQFIRQLGDSARIVLGNHDLHFLAVALGVIESRKNDTFDELLQAPDLADYIDWLCQQPLIYTDSSGDFSMVHAGIPPGWSLQQAQRLAAEVEAAIQGNDASAFFKNMYGNQPDCWNEQLQGYTRLRVITNYLTRMRYCTAADQLDLTSKNGPAPSDQYQAWFAHSQRKTADDAIIFGHWAALEGKADVDNVFALDTGCVWGGCMTLMNLETRERHREQCAS